MKPTTPRIVIFDNDMAYIQVLQELLEEEGYEVQPYTDGAEDLAKLRAKLPNLIILDVRLGHSLCGWDLLQMLRLDPTTMKIPLILCTGDDFVLRQQQDRLRALRVRTQPKPFDINEMVATIEAALGERGECERRV